MFLQIMLLHHLVIKPREDFNNKYNNTMVEFSL